MAFDEFVCYELLAGLFVQFRFGCELNDLSFVWICEDWYWIGGLYEWMGTVVWVTDLICLDFRCVAGSVIRSWFCSAGS
jgi:hypothetical protein